MKENILEIKSTIILQIKHPELDIQHAPEFVYEKYFGRKFVFKSKWFFVSLILSFFAG